MQTDYDIVDQTGLSFLADLNTTLGAIVSNNSGATQPATTFAYMWWADTTSGVLKQRNAANSAWVNKYKLNGGELAELAGATFTGDISAPNLSGTNTGDQDLSGKADQATTYTETEVDTLLDDKAAIAGGTSANFTAMPQVGGDPIVESGSNADGEWTRWADGTLNCRNAALTMVFSNVATLLIRWTYPVAFAGLPVVLNQPDATPAANQRSTTHYANGRTVTFADLTVISDEGAYSAGDTLSISAKAEGRWS